MACHFLMWKTNHLRIKLIRGVLNYVYVSHLVVSASFVTPWTLARHAALSMEFFRQECLTWLPFPPPGNLPDPGLNPGLQHHRQTLYYLSRREALKLSMSEGKLTDLDIYILFNIGRYIFLKSLTHSQKLEIKYYHVYIYYYD